MSPRVWAPAQAVEVNVLRLAKELSQLHEKAVGYVPQLKDIRDAELHQGDGIAPTFCTCDQFAALDAKNVHS